MLPQSTDSWWTSALALRLVHFNVGSTFKVNNSVYFVVKQAIDVATVDQTERVFAFLAKTRIPFTISVRHDETLSAHQYVDFFDITTDKVFYNVVEFKVFRSLWRDVEYELFENKYSPAMARFTGDKLDWYVKLNPESSLKFKEDTNISTTYVASQGHLDVYKSSVGPTLSRATCIPDAGSWFFNHTIEADMYVIPLGPEMRIVHLREETQISSPDHETIHLDVGEYLLIHPRPRRDRVD